LPPAAPPPWLPVSNVAAFGAFVDIRVNEDGLVHVPQLADRVVQDPGEIAKASGREAGEAA